MEGGSSGGPSGRVLIVGGLYLDVKLEVPRYPPEDTSCRCISVVKRRGGNSSNTSGVLADLLSLRPSLSVWWVGATPPPSSDPEAQLVLEDLRRSGVNADLREQVGTGGMPTAYITISRESGSRTIVSTRNGMREVSPAHFTKVITNPTPPGGSPWLWCHLECREMPSVLEMARDWVRTHGGGGGRLSVEVEKPSMQPTDLLPLLPLCDLCVLSREFVEAHAVDVLKMDGLKRDGLERGGLEMDGLNVGAAEAAGAGAGSAGAGVKAADEGSPPLPIRFIRALRAASDAPRGLWVVPWGSRGAFAVDGSGHALHAPAIVSGAVVDSTGAGDTFIAAVVYALLMGHAPAAALRCGCAVAGGKVSQVGFEGLRAAVPEDLRTTDIEDGSGLGRSNR